MITELWTLPARSAETIKKPEGISDLSMAEHNLDDYVIY